MNNTNPNYDYDEDWYCEFRMLMMRRKLEQQLIKDLPDYNKLIKELKNDQR